MRRTTIGNLWVLAKRPSTPWPQNPWINSASLGPSPGTEASTQAAAYISTHGREQSNDSTITAERYGQDKKQQKVAINAWEDEGGLTAAPTRVVDLL
jgi:hypothetical protein